MDDLKRLLSDMAAASRDRGDSHSRARVWFEVLAVSGGLLFAMPLPTHAGGKGGAPHHSAPHASAPRPQVQHHSAPAHHNPGPAHHNPAPAHHNPGPVHHATPKAPVHHNPKPQPAPQHHEPKSKEPATHHEPNPSRSNPGHVEPNEGSISHSPASTKSQATPAPKSSTSTGSSSSTSAILNGSKKSNASNLPGSAGFNAALKPKTSTASFGSKSAGFHANPSSNGISDAPTSAGFGSNPSSNSISDAPTSAGFGRNPGSAGFGANPGSAGFGFNPSSAGFGANPGSTGVHSYLSPIASRNVIAPLNSMGNVSNGGNVNRVNGGRIRSGGGSGNRLVYLPMFSGFNPWWNPYGSGVYQGRHHRRYYNSTPYYGYPQRYYAVRRTSARPNSLVNNGNPLGTAMGRLGRDLAGIAPGSQVTQAKKDRIASDLANAVDGGVQPNSQKMGTLASNLVEGLAARPAGGNRSLNSNSLAKSLVSVVNSPFRARSEVTLAVDRVLSDLRTAGVGPDQTQAISGDLNALAFSEAPNEKPQVQQAALKS